MDSAYKTFGRVADGNETLRSLAPIFQFMSDAIVIMTTNIDPPGPFIVFVNQAFSILTGYQPEDVLGKSLSILNGRTTFGDGIAPLRQALLEGQQSFAETIVQRKDSSELMLEWRCVPLFDTTGAMCYWLAIPRDTGRSPHTDAGHNSKVSEQDRHEASSRLDTIVDSLPSQIFYVDCERRYQFTNKAHEDRFGFSREDCYGRHIRDVYSEEVYSKIKPYIERALSGEKIRYECDSGDGEQERHVDVTYIPDFGQDGTVQGFYALVNDITERKRVEQALQRSEEKYRSLFENAPDSLYIFDLATRRVVDVNENATKRLGYGRSELIGKKIEDVLRPPYPGLAEDITEELIDLSGMLFEFTEVGKDGAVMPVEVSAHAVEYDGLQLLQCFSRDISQRKRIEHSLRILHKIYADPTLSFDAKLTRLLEAGCWLLNLPIGILSHIEGEEYRVVQTVNPDQSIRPGDVFELGKIYCRETLKADGVMGFEYAKGSIWETHPCYQVFRLEAYLGVKVVVGNRAYGTLNFSSFEPRRTRFTPTDKEIISLMAQWIGGDIARQRAEQELRESEQRLRDAIDSVTDGVALFDSEDRLILFNENTRKSYPMLADLLVPGIKWEDMFRAFADRGFINIPKDQIDEWVERCIREHRTLGATRTYQTTTGRWDELREYLTRDNGLFLVRTDITERKRAEEALFQEKERAEVTLHSIADAVITTDARGGVDYLNPVAETLTGWPLDKARGRPLEAIFKLIDEQSRGLVANPVVACLQEGKTVKSTRSAVLLHRRGRECAVEVSTAPIHGRDGKVFGVVLVFRDVSEHRRIAKQMAHEATHDALTGLVNRREFERRLEHAVASAKQYGSRHALCYLDLDRFKIVNDIAGHAAGDELLKQVRWLLAGKFRERDTLARLGGDEFGLLLDNCALEEAVKISEIVIATFQSHRFTWGGRSFQVGASIGLAPVTAESENAAQVLRQADVACYTAKELGRNCVHVHQAEGGKPRMRQVQILHAANLTEALEGDRFCLYYQPIISLSADSKTPAHYEFLLRLLEGPGQLVLPQAFIPTAERYGLMGAIDRWVIRTAFRHSAHLLSSHSRAGIAINLSANSLDDYSLLDYVHQQFDEFSVSPERVCFEITETAAIQNLSQAIEFVREIKKTGSRLALDDFGTGLSSFAYLKTLPADYLKIDGSFVRDMIENPVDHAMVAAINEVGHIMGIQTIAEYAHSERIVERLKELGVDYAQGNALGSPQPLAALEEEVASGER